MLIKKFIYQIWQVPNKIIWRLSGGRREKAMGLSLNLHPDTVWPGRRGLLLPKEHCKSKIVAYADLVQAHSLCNALSTIHDKPVIIDVGAHHGEYACLLGGLIKERKGGIIIAVEPDRANVAILKDNIDRNKLQDIVKVVEIAVTDSAGKMHFVKRGSEGHLLPSNNTSENKASTVHVDTLRNILTHFNLSKVDILLIDVEGAELPVLKGFPWEILKPAMIFCELHPYNWPLFGYSGKDIQAFLEAQRYRCLDMYFYEHERFDDFSYIGPCFFLPK